MAGPGARLAQGLALEEQGGDHRRRHVATPDGEEAAPDEVDGLVLVAGLGGGRLVGRGHGSIMTAAAAAGNGPGCYPRPMPRRLAVADAPAGWLLTREEVLVLAAGGAALDLLDAAGARLGRLEGPPAAAFRTRLAGEAAPSPLLDRLLAALGLPPSPRAAPLRPADLLARGGWGQLFVELTARCNERCVHCYASSGPERTEALDRPTAEAVVREAAELGFAALQLTGGEALLCGFLVDLVRQARAAGIPTVEVYTNGVLLDAARYAALRVAGAAFAFSLYAADPAVHDRITGLPGSHRRTVAAIERAAAGGSAVRVGVVLLEADLAAEARAAVALARRLGVPAGAVGIDAARSVGRGAYAGAAAEDAAAADAARPGPDAGEAGGGHATARGGRAAVLPDGSVTPCIFARDLVLGRVGPAGGLRASLEGPAARLGPLDVEAVAAALAGARARLSCGGCRVARTLLAPAAPAGVAS